MKKEESILIGKAIHRLRLEQNLSQEALAHEARIHRTYIGAVERGERNVTVVNLVRIAKALRLKASDLLLAAGL